MAVPYQYIMIRSRLSGLYLDVSGKSTAPGAKVVLWDKNNQDNQIWYYDSANATIRTKMNDFCLEHNAGENSMVINPFNGNSGNQKWDIVQNAIKSRNNPSQVFDVLRACTDKGAQVGLYNFNGNNNQQWDFEAVGGSANAHGGGPQTGASMQWQKREFMIKSEMDDKVIDIKGNNTAPGALICMYKINKQKNQLWYQDQSGFIKSSLNDLVFHADDQGSSLKMQPYNGNAKHQWRIEGNKVVNNAGSCLDIKGGKCNDGSEICAYTFKNGSNQRWTIVYV